MGMFLAGNDQRHEKMTITKENAVKLSGNAFGELVKSFREQRRWSQGKLAQEWGHTREYVSLIERGERKLEKLGQVEQIAEILGIPTERLEEVGKSGPRRRTHAEQPPIAENVLLQALLEPALTSTKLLWPAWLAGAPNHFVAQNLTSLTMQLEDAFTTYRGQFKRPARSVLAYAQDVQGRMAFDQLKLTEASGHFQEMLDLGEELENPTIITLAQMQRSDLMRKRGRYETAVRMLTALSPTIEQTEDALRGPYYQILARAHAQHGYEKLFLEALDTAQEIARDIKESIDTHYTQFNLLEVLQERAWGLTMLGQAEKALSIYAQTDKMRPFRPLRAQGLYVILKAQAYAYSGDMNTGIDLALQGIELARMYGSPRHISLTQEMYDQLSVTALGKHARMKELKEAVCKGMGSHGDGRQG